MLGSNNIKRHIEQFQSAFTERATFLHLLNHLIHELLPPKGDGMRWSNSDPITGQAAWFDLRVKIEKVPPQDEADPGFAAIASPVGRGPRNLRWKVGR